MWQKACGKFFCGRRNSRAIVTQLIQIGLGGNLRINQCPGRFRLSTDQVCPREAGNHNPGQQEDQDLGETRRWTTQYDHTRVVGRQAVQLLSDWHWLESTIGHAQQQATDNALASRPCSSAFVRRAGHLCSRQNEAPRRGRRMRGLSPSINHPLSGMNTHDSALEMMELPPLVSSAANLVYSTPLRPCFSRAETRSLPHPPWSCASILVTAALDPPAQAAIHLNADSRWGIAVSQSQSWCPWPQGTE